jgi:uncharacterized protein YbaR (Trm112 family)
MNGNGGWAIDAELRAMLVCPSCRGELLDVDAGLRCVAERLVYPVVDGTPWLLVEEARREVRIDEGSGAR